MTLEQKFQTNPADYRALLVLKCRNHPVCSKILRVLERKPMNVTEIQIACEADKDLKYCIVQSTISLYLGQMRALGLVEFEQSGKMRYYSLPKTDAPAPSMAQIAKPKRPRIETPEQHANYSDLVKAADSLVGLR
jgi:DNA-binding transcriptional ArsR family regulator